MPSPHSWKGGRSSLSRLRTCVVDSVWCWHTSYRTQAPIPRWRNMVNLSQSFQTQPLLSQLLLQLRLAWPTDMANETQEEVARVVLLGKLSFPDERNLRPIILPFLLHWRLTCRPWYYRASEPMPAETNLDTWMGETYLPLFTEAILQVLLTCSQKNP